METKRRSAAPDREMSLPPLPEALDAALDRLAAAMDRLRAAAQRQADIIAAGPGADDGLGFLHTGDVKRLTAERDAAVAQAETLRDANDAALQRIDRIESSIETSIDMVMRELAERPADDTAPEDTP